MSGSLEALVRRGRETRQRRERDFIRDIRVIRLELMVLRLQDRVRELEHGEWAQLEEVREP